MMSISRTKVLFPGILAISLLLFSIDQGNCQDRTGATDQENRINKKKQAPKKRKLVFIVKNDIRGILYGNRCFLDVQRSLGFEYLVQPKGQVLNRSCFSRNMHNLGVKFILYFRNGPFWQIKINKKKKECRRLSGDFVG